MANGEQWYGVAAGDQLHQGDLIDSCPVVTPLAPIKQDDTEAEVNVDKYNVIILSQSCDLAVRENTGKASLDFVLVCPVWPLEVFAETVKHFQSSDAKEALRLGHQPSYHLLNKCNIDGFTHDFLVVDFTSVYSVHFDTLAAIAGECGNHLGLLSPYKEHLAQAFARFFMRVGLPADIPKFSKRVRY